MERNLSERQAEIYRLQEEIISLSRERDNLMLIKQSEETSTLADGFFNRFKS